MARVTKPVHEQQDQMPQSSENGVDLDSFGAFYRREYSATVSLALALCGDFASAEDLAQEAFVAAYRRWKEIAGYDIPAAWVRRVVVYKARSRFRRLLTEAKAWGGARARPESATAEIGDSSESFWAAVRQLPRRQAQCIALRYIDDLEAESIAAVIGCSPATVRVHLHRAHHTLAHRLDLDMRSSE